MRNKSFHSLPTYSINGTPKCLKINQSSNTNMNNVTDISNKSIHSVYLDRKHQATKEKIDKMRFEAENKMLSELKAKPTISRRSKEIVNRLFVHIEDKKMTKSKSFVERNKQRGISCSFTFSNAKQVDQYKNIMESRSRKIDELKQNERDRERRMKRRQSARMPMKIKKPLPIEELKCQRDKHFNQEYQSFNQNEVLSIRERLQKYYDDRTEYKTIPFNQTFGLKKSQTYHNTIDTNDYYSHQTKQTPVMLINHGDKREERKDVYLNDIRPRPSIRKEIKTQQSRDPTSRRRSEDIQLLTAFVQKLGSNISEQFIDTYSNNNTSQRNYTYQQSTTPRSKLNPNAVNYAEERMKMIEEMQYHH